ncbi:F0F1 ATP synthase subunit gamma [Geminicoccaceae bacterium 1502E]|uniref:ATP synthase gamma chain n=1 Tax=Marinimicrococcus flavescens TaxID=3031815 RepID=A0AAP3XRK3_9PROT|nr:F0F1 ATP synthase subunit gamma [Marinimicrococcus flavescens]MDX6749448.1 F0F1 ATP synthase subunit gamma [Geminicoccaceae bacterium 1502E]
MASLKELRNRIDSVKQTRKITSAMKLVAASKLKRAQEQAEASRPFADRMSAMLANLAAGVRDLPDAPRLLGGTGSDETHLIVVATADRGLCGGFNSSIVRGVRRRVTALQAEGKQVKLMLVGRKGRDMLRREFGDIIVEYVDGIAGKRRVDFGDAQLIADKILERFDAGEFDVCTLVFNKFKSAITQVLTFKQLIPVEPPVRDEEAAAEGGALYEFEPSEERILDELLPRNLAIQIFGALLENSASEQGARMAAMDSATRNAGDMIHRLTLSYNRQRQAQITKELIEIISGAEAV